MNWKLIFNPFGKFDDKTLLISGISIYLILNLIGYFSGSKMDGILHFDRLNKENPIAQLLLSLAIVVVSILLIWGLGKFFNSRTRLIDILNTVLISMFPMIFMLIISEIPFFNNALSNTEKLVQQNPNSFTPEILIVLLFSFLILPLLIYNIILLYNGFKTATNTKKWQHIAIYFALIFIINTITQILI